MSTESTPAPQSGVAEDVQQGPRIAVSALVNNLRDYGLILALIAIMIFFQFTTNGTLFKPVNLSNLVQQNSFIIVMALGMLLVIVSGHIDLSVGSVAGFIGALAAMMMVIWPLGFFSNPLVVSIICLVIGGAIGAAQGYWIAYHRIPSFIVTLAGMLIFRGICQALLGGGSSVGPLPDGFKALSSGFIPDVIGTLTLIPPTVNAAGKTIVGSGLSLHMTTIVIGIVGVLAYVYFGLEARRTRERHGYEAEPFALFAVKTAGDRRARTVPRLPVRDLQGPADRAGGDGAADRAVRLRHQAHDDRPPHLCAWAAMPRRRSCRASRPSG